MTTLTTLRLIAPEFASVDDATVQAMLDLAPLLIDVNLYAANVRDLAVVYQACILLSQRKASEDGFASASGDLIMEKEGDLSRSYSSGDGNSDRFGSDNQYELCLKRLGMNAMLGGITRMANDVPAL
jgi:hypothetical protein